MRNAPGLPERGWAGLVGRGVGRFAEGASPSTLPGMFFSS